MTGYLDTNYRGKAEKALEALRELDLVYVHVEAPDESSHEGSLENKIKAIEDFDREIVGRVWEGLKAFEDYSIMVVTDHFTPVSRMTHTREPVPLVVFRSTAPPRNPRVRGFSERSAIEGEVAFLKGDELMAWFLRNRIFLPPTHADQDVFFSRPLPSVARARRDHGEKANAYFKKNR